MKNKWIDCFQQLYILTPEYKNMKNKKFIKSYNKIEPDMLRDFADMESEQAKEWAKANPDLPYKKKHIKKANGTDRHSK